MFTLALKARNNATALPAPNVFKPLVKRRFFGRGGGGIVFEFKSGLRRVWRKRATALPADRALRGHVLHLLKATVRAFHTGLGRRRFGHAFRGRTFLSASEGGLGWLVVTRSFGPTAACCFDAHAAGNFRFTNESRAFLNDEAGGFQIALERAFRFQFATFAHRDVSLHLAINRDRLGFNFRADVCVLADRQRPIGINFAFHFAINEQFLLELDGAFDFDVAGKDVFAGMFSHKLFVLVWL